MLAAAADLAWTVFQAGLFLLGWLYLYRVYRAAQVRHHRPPRPQAPAPQALPGSPRRELPASGTKPLSAPSLRELGWKE